MLENSGFQVTVVEAQNYVEVPPGIIVRQQPAPGNQVPEGGSVTIEVSK